MYWLGAGLLLLGLFQLVQRHRAVFHGQQRNDCECVDGGSSITERVKTRRGSTKRPVVRLSLRMCLGGAEIKFAHSFCLGAAIRQSEPGCVTGSCGAGDAPDSGLSAEPADDALRGPISELKARLMKDVAFVDTLKQLSQPMDSLYLQRWLQGKRMDMDEAESAAKYAAQWRLANVPLGYVPEEEVANEIAAKKVFMQGCDTQGRPVVIIQACKHFMGRPAETKRFIFYVLDVLCEAAKAHKDVNPVGRVCAIIDLQGLRLCNLDVSALLAIFETLKQHYPERLGEMWFLNAPFIFWSAWKLVSAAISQSTRDKLKFATSADAAAQLSGLVPAHVLPEQYGGTGQLVPVDEAKKMVKAQVVASIAQSGHAAGGAGAATPTRRWHRWGRQPSAVTDAVAQPHVMYRILFFWRFFVRRRAQAAVVATPRQPLFSRFLRSRPRSIGPTRPPLFSRLLRQSQRRLTAGESRNWRLRRRLQTTDSAAARPRRRVMAVIMRNILLQGLWLAVFRGARSAISWAWRWRARRRARLLARLNRSMSNASGLSFHQKAAQSLQSHALPDLLPSPVATDPKVLRQRQQKLQSHRIQLDDEKDGAPTAAVQQPTSTNTTLAASKTDMAVSGIHVVNQARRNSWLAAYWPLPQAASLPTSCAHEQLALHGRVHSAPVAVA